MYKKQIRRSLRSAAPGEVFGLSDGGGTTHRRPAHTALFDNLDFADQGQRLHLAFDRVNDTEDAKDRRDKPQ